MLAIKSWNQTVSSNPFKCCILSILKLTSSSFIIISSRKKEMTVGVLMAANFTNLFKDMFGRFTCE